MIAALLRTRQWYKNLAVFLPVIFAEAAFAEGYLLKVALAFASLCLLSSASYIINDIADAKDDRKHPEKSKRPVAAGRVSAEAALAASLALLVSGLAVAAQLSALFALSALALFASTQVYTFFLKRVMFADIISISTNFVIRAVSGALVINVRVSPWLILCTFFLSMFLAAAKRKGDLGLAKNGYTQETAEKLMTFATAALVMSYSLYSFLSIYPLLIITLPFAIFVIFSYSHLSDRNKAIARNPEKALLDPRIASGIILWVALAFVVVYLKPVTWIF